MLIVGFMIGCQEKPSSPPAPKSDAVSSQDKAAYEQQAKSALVEWRKRIDVLDKESDKLRGSPKATRTQQVTYLRDRERAAETQLEKMKLASGSTWQDMRVQLESLMTEMEQTYQRATAPTRSEGRVLNA